MEGRNLCHEAGCPDLCCRSPIRVVLTQESFSDLPPKAKKVGYWDIKELTIPGLYFTEWYDGPEKKLILRIIFPRRYCPDHTSNGCALYPQPRWPWCRTTPFNGQECDKFRNEYPLLRKQPEPYYI